MKTLFLKNEAVSLQECSISFSINIGHPTQGAVKSMTDEF